MLGSSDPGSERRALRPGVAIYTCCETLEQDGGPVARSEACQTYARKRGLVDHHPLIRQYVEPVGAKPGNRPLLRDIVLAAQRREFGIVLIFSLQSISVGDPQDCLEIVRMIEGAGAGIISVRDPWIDSTISGAPAVRAALEWVLKSKGEAHAERVRRGIARSRAEARGRGENPEWGRARGATLSKDTALVSEIIRLRDGGLSLAKTAKAVGKPETTVARLEGIGRAARDRQAQGADADVSASE